jgi:hypothetical protein
VSQAGAEQALETRLGMEAALRCMALPRHPRKDRATDARWILESTNGYRAEVTRVDRSVVALLSGDHLAAAHELDGAGPVGTALMCLRAVLQAQRRTSASGRRTAASLSVRHGAGLECPYVAALDATVLVAAADKHVWDSALAPAEALMAGLIRPGETTATVSPLVRIAAELVALPLLARRAHAAVFTAGLARVLMSTAPARAGSALACARVHAALTIAYVTADDVHLDDGTLHRSPPG